MRGPQERLKTCNFLTASLFRFSLRCSHCFLEGRRIHWSMASVMKRTSCPKKGHRSPQGRTRAWGLLWHCLQEFEQNKSTSTTCIDRGEKRTEGLWEDGVIFHTSGAGLSAEAALTPRCVQTLPLSGRNLLRALPTGGSPVRTWLCRICMTLMLLMSLRRTDNTGHAGILTRHIIAPSLNTAARGGQAWTGARFDGVSVSEKAGQGGIQTRTQAFAFVAMGQSARKLMFAGNSFYRDTQWTGDVFRQSALLTRQPQRTAGGCDEWK